MFSQRNNPYCELLQILYWQRKESTKMGGYCLCELLIGSWFHRLSPDIHRLTAGWETDCPSPISKHQAMCLALVAGLNEPLLTWGTDSGYVSVGVGMKCWGTKHVMEMTKWTCLHGSTCKSFNYLFFFFLHNCWVVGKFCGLSGSGAGLWVGLVRLFYIIWL